MYGRMTSKHYQPRQDVYLRRERRVSWHSEDVPLHLIDTPLELGGRPQPGHEQHDEVVDDMHHDGYEQIEAGQLVAHREDESEEQLQEGTRSEHWEVCQSECQ